MDLIGSIGAGGEDGTDDACIDVCIGVCSIGSISICARDGAGGNDGDDGDVCFVGRGGGDDCVG